MFSIVQLLVYIPKYVSFYVTNNLQNIWKKCNMFSVFVRERYQNGVCLYKSGNTLINKSILFYLLH